MVLGMPQSRRLHVSWAYLCESISGFSTLFHGFMVLLQIPPS